MKIFNSLTYIILLCTCFKAFSQNKQVAITMDDMPFNVMNKYELDSALSITDKLLHQIEKSQTPVAGFITGKNCLHQDQADKRLKLLLKWINHPLVSLGNHTINHYNSSKISIDTFKMEVIENNYLIQSFAKDKPIKYFRFPYNATGKDSVDQQNHYQFLHQMNYIVAPFTVESSDYVYDALYVNELKKGNYQRADSIAKCYIQHTILQFHFFENLSQQLFGRPIKHIYQCHANKIHADYYDELITELKKIGYEFITMDDAMSDSVYQTKENFIYYGVSWMYRWIPDKKIRKSYMLKEIEVSNDLYKEYEKLSE